jgi:branched-subunit amino acid transport protein
VTALVAVLGAAVATYLVRVLLITVVPASRLPVPVRRTLPHVGPAVLAAIIAAALFPSAGGVQPGFLIGAALTAAVAWRSGNVLVATGVGVAAVAVYQLL